MHLRPSTWPKALEGALGEALDMTTEQTLNKLDARFALEDAALDALKRLARLWGQV